MISVFGHVANLNPAKIKITMLECRIHTIESRNYHSQLLLETDDYLRSWQKTKEKVSDWLHKVVIILTRI